VDEKSFADAVLVLFGHGSTVNVESSAPVLQHVAELRRRRIFAEVREAFWKQDPRLTELLPELAAPQIFLLPFFTAKRKGTPGVSNGEALKPSSTVGRSVPIRA